MDKTKIIKSHPSLWRLFVFVSPSATATTLALMFQYFYCLAFCRLNIYLEAPPVLCFHYQHATLADFKLYILLAFMSHALCFLILAVFRHPTKRDTHIFCAFFASLPMIRRHDYFFHLLVCGARSSAGKTSVCLRRG